MGMRDGMGNLIDKVAARGRFQSLDCLFKFYFEYPGAEAPSGVTEVPAINCHAD